MQLTERHDRLIKKDKELEKLFEQAAIRRKGLLKQNNVVNKKFNDEKESEKEKFIFKPFKSSDHLVKFGPNDNELLVSAISPRGAKTLQRCNEFYSNQNLPETDMDTVDSKKKYVNEDIVQSNENLDTLARHKASLVLHRLSTDGVDMVDNGQTNSTTSPSINNTNSSGHSRMTYSTTKSSSYEQSSSEGNTHSSTYAQLPVQFHANMCPFVNQKYQGSPVVMIDDQLRAGESDNAANRPKYATGKPPIIPRLKKRTPKLETTEYRPAPCTIVDNRHIAKDRPSPVSPESPSDIPTSFIRRTKKKLIEEQMRKRFSVGDYSTRALIEWESNLSYAHVLQLSLSGNLPEAHERRKISTESASFFHGSHDIGMAATAHNFVSDLNIPRYNSSESITGARVSFKVTNGNEGNIDPVRFSKGTSFFRRSLNDIAAALRNVTSSEKVHSPKQFRGSSRSHSKKHGMYKKRDSISSDLLYSVPPFVRRHLPADISGATKMGPQLVYVASHLPASTPNLIAELDPTFHERYSSNENSSNEKPSCSHPLTKRSRSYRLSFIEDAHSVTTKKLASDNAPASSSSGPGDAVPRFVQPRRRVASQNAASIKKHRSHARDPRSRSSSRFSCSQQ